MTEAEAKLQKMLFNEAMGLIEHNADRADHYRSITVVAVDALEATLLMVKSGRINDARERIESALALVKEMVRA
jgi:hypothetical protein